MIDPLFSRNIEVRRGARLPHWTIPNGIYHVIFRLADSLPRAAIERYRAEREALRQELSQRGFSQARIEARLRALFTERVDQLLDQGLGACWLRRPVVAQLVADTLRYFHGTRYHVFAGCVMPNHTHIVVRPLGGHSLSEILKSWKGYSARQANRHLGRTGEFWETEYYDHLIRDADDLANAISYVLENPVAAGLKEWPWVWKESDSGRGP